MAGAPAQRPDKLSVVVFSGDYRKVHYALAAAAAAAAIDMPATLFFTMGACRALLAADDAGRPGWHALDGDAAATDADHRQRGVAGFEELVESCAALGVRVLVCEMGLRAMALEDAPLRDDLEIEAGGLVTFLNDASASGAMLFV
jgi:peroxiredoxin family protein